PTPARTANAPSAFITCRSVWHTPQALTRTSTSPARGSGMGISSTCSPPGARSSIATRMVCISLVYFVLVCFGRDQHRHDRDRRHEDQIQRERGAALRGQEGR